MHLKDYLLTEGRGAGSSLSRALEVPASLISDWANENRPVPVERCAAIEQATAGSVTCEELRPDEPWSRIPDETWPNPKGRPVLDFAAIKEAA